MLRSSRSIFTHDSKVPTTFALAVWRIMHNQARDRDWELVVQEPNAISMIRSILIDNNVFNLEDEIRWWTDQLYFPETV